MFDRYRKMIFDAIRSDRAACSQCKHDAGEDAGCGAVHNDTGDNQYANCPVVERAVVNAYNFRQLFPDHATGASPNPPMEATPLVPDPKPDPVHVTRVTGESLYRGLIAFDFGQGMMSPFDVEVPNKFLVGASRSGVRVLSLRKQNQPDAALLLTVPEAINLAAHLLAITSADLDAVGRLIARMDEQ